jgi:hypothetical protein
MSSFDAAVLSGTSAKKVTYSLSRHIGAINKRVGFDDPLEFLLRPDDDVCRKPESLAQLFFNVGSQLCSLSSSAKMTLPL